MQSLNPPQVNHLLMDLTIYFPECSEAVCFSGDRVRAAQDDRHRSTYRRYETETRTRSPCAGLYLFVYYIF